MIHTIDMHYSDFALTCYTEIPSVSKIIKKFHIVYDLSSSYIHNFYNYKQESIGDFFQYIKRLLKYIDHPKLIT